MNQSTTLDEACDAFEATPNKTTANNLACIAKQYLDDEMIEPGTYEFILAEIRAISAAEVSP